MAFVRGGRRGRGGRPELQRGPGASGGTIRRAYWYQVTVINGSRYSRVEILGNIERFLAPQKYHPICYQVVRSDSIFFVERWQMAHTILSCTRKITMSDGQQLVLKIKENRPPMTPVDDVMVARMKTAMAKRYVAENKALDLSRFVRDPEFVDGLYCNLIREPVLIATLKIINENIPDLMALNLTGNGINSFDTSAPEFEKLKSLRILHLSENNIAQMAALNIFKNSEISELVLERNPVALQFSDRTHYVRYALSPGVTEVRKRFPKLTKLDNIEMEPLVTFDIGDEATLPPPQAAFVSSPEGREFVKAFLSQYYQIYDSDNRLELGQAYAETAVFSLTCGYPAYTPRNSPRLNTYFSEARNLLRVSDFPRRKSKLRMGRNNIVEFLFKHVPKSQHDLLSFAVDLPFFTPALISLSVTGLFRETGVGSPSNWPLRHFSRAFLIVPMGAGFCIVNETLFVSNATDEQAEVAFKAELPKPAVASPPAPQPTPVPVLDDAIKLQMVQAVAQQTGMNLDWSKKCLEDTEWDFQRAGLAFTELQKRGGIPAEAFVK